MALQPDELVDAHLYSSCSIASAYLNRQLVSPHLHRNTGGDERTELLTQAHALYMAHLAAVSRDVC